MAGRERYSPRYRADPGRYDPVERRRSPRERRTRYGASGYERPYRRRGRRPRGARPFGRRAARGYAREYAEREAEWAPYGHDFFRWGAPVPGHGIYPEHHWGGGMIYGLEGAGWAPFGWIHFPGYGHEYGDWRREEARRARTRRSKRRRFRARGRRAARRRPTR